MKLINFYYDYYSIVLTDKIIMEFTIRGIEGKAWLQQVQITCILYCTSARLLLLYLAKVKFYLFVCLFTGARKRYHSNFSGPLEQRGKDRVLVANEPLVCSHISGTLWFVSVRQPYAVGESLRKRLEGRLI